MATIKTEDFLKAIEAVMPGTSNKGIIEGSDSIVFGNGMLTSYNDRISVSVFFESEIVGAVVAQDLHKIVKGIKDDTLLLEKKENVLQIKSVGTEAGLSMFSEDNIQLFIDAITLTEEEEDSFEPVPKNFVDGLNLCQFSTSSNANDPMNLFNVYMESDCLYSSDRYRVTKYIMSDQGIGNAMIPRTAIPYIVSFRPTHYFLKRGWMYFMDENDTLLMCRLSAGDKFAPIEKILNTHEVDHTVKFPEGFKEILPEVLAVSDEVLDVSKHVKIKIKDGEIMCHLQKEKGWLKKKYKISDRDTDIEFTVSAAFLNEVLKITDIIELGKNNNIVIKSENIIRYISLPMQKK